MALEYLFELDKLLSTAAQALKSWQQDPRAYLANNSYIDPSSTAHINQFLLSPALDTILNHRIEIKDSQSTRETAACRVPCQRLEDWASYAQRL